MVYEKDSEKIKEKFIDLKEKVSAMDSEYDFILRFATGKIGEGKTFDDNTMKNQLRGLWTAYCLHNAEVLQMQKYHQQADFLLASMIAAKTYPVRGKKYWLAFEMFMSEHLPEKFRNAIDSRLWVRDVESEFFSLVEFAEKACFDDELCRDQFRMLWTAFCFHNNLDVDTRPYDHFALKLWEHLQETEDGTSEWADFDGFGNFLCKYLV